jgi:predicted MFS family arabinose efflux permease
VAWGISFLPMVSLHSLWVSYLSMGFAGFFFAAYPPMARTVVQKLVPKHLQGRVFGIRSSVMGLGIPTGGYMGSLFTQWMSPSVVVGVTGAFMILLGAIGIMARSFRTIDA